MAISVTILLLGGALLFWTPIVWSVQNRTELTATAGDYPLPFDAAIPKCFVAVIICVHTNVPWKIQSPLG